MKIEKYHLKYSDIEGSIEQPEISAAIESDSLQDQLIQEMLQMQSDALIHINRSGVKPTASVIISVFNAVYFLDRAVNSVLQQENAPPIEILIIYDKGSNNETATLLRECINHYTESEFRIAFMSHKTDFREKMLSPELCNGEFIFYLDYDDEFAPSKVINQISDLNEKNKLFSFTNQRIINQDNETVKERVLNANPRLNLSDLTKANKASMSAICFKKDFYSQYLKPLVAELSDSYFDFVLPDYFFTLIASSTDQVSYISTPLLYYRTHQSNVFYINAESTTGKLLILKAKVNEKRIKTFNAFSMASSILNFKVDFTFGFVLLLNTGLNDVSLFRFGTRLFSSRLFSKLTSFFTETLQDRSFLGKKE